MEQLLEKTTTLNLLYDFYRPLLNEKQQTFVELYYVEDWSLSEIAEHFSISRQAVHDHIKRVERLLYEWENRLQLVEKHQRRKQIVGELKKKLKEHRCYCREWDSLLDRLLDID